MYYYSMRLEARPDSGLQPIVSPHVGHEGSGSGTV